MGWLILGLLWLACAPVVAAGQAAGAPPSGDPDALYASREHLPAALEAASIWDRRLEANPRDFEAAWKLARACYWLGSHVPAAEQRARYERGIEAGERAAEVEPRRPEGHFWTAANMGALAESFGLRAGLRYRGAIKRALETVLALDPAFEYGSADRALGRWYAKVPGLFGGSRTKAIEHLERSLKYDPASAASHFFLAEIYLDMDDRDDAARRHLQNVLEAPIDAEWGPETKEFQTKAKPLLEKLQL
jgi:tetratricopeptide (TPR) repeat protein